MVPVLGGHLEVVHLDYLANQNDLFSATVATGRENVLIHAPPRYDGQDCLVRMRFGRTIRGEKQMGRFVSSDIPEGSAGLEHDAYVLLGEWEQRMSKEGEYPTLTEIYKYYDPGNMSFVFYFQKGHGSRSGNRVRIAPEKIVMNPLDFVSELRVIDTKKAVRAILAESPTTLERLAETVLEHHWTPIFMEPWRYK